MVNIIGLNRAIVISFRAFPNRHAKMRNPLSQKLLNNCGNFLHKSSMTVVFNKKKT